MFYFAQFITRIRNGNLLRTGFNWSSQIRIHIFNHYRNVQRFDQVEAKYHHHSSEDTVPYRC